MRSIAPRESAARRYRIEKYLTEGGMGAIYLGKKMGSGGFQREVVLKQLLPEYTSRPEFRDLFFREAKISATLDHANIVHTFDLVESDQSLFIVMEYVRGADLRTILRRARQRQRELSPKAAIHIALEILNGLAYAHGRRDQNGNLLSIIHRDVSPSNIICSVQGEAKLSDFGIAKASTHSSVFYRVRGKVGYMSPEQARSKPIDHRCDLYSLAVCLYESLSGERLFVGDLNTPADEIYGHVILPISQKRAGLPAALDEVLARALATDIADRHQSAAELSDALRTVAHRTGLGFSAPELAAHLREILGSDPDCWLRDEGTPRTGTAKVAAKSIGLVGKEAASIGLVPDGPEDEPPRIVLSPTSVSGSKDFDLDSMLDDEATRPGAQARGLAPPRSAPEPAAPERQPSRRGEPPAVWTRNSGPVPLGTPPPERTTASGRVAAPPVPAAAKVGAAPPISLPRSMAPAGRVASGPVSTAPLAPPPPVPLPGRIAPRNTQHGIAAVPPPFPSAARGAPPPPAQRPSAQLPVPLPIRPAIEDVTPPPPMDTPLPAHAPIGYAEQAPPPRGGATHARTLHGFGSGPPAGRPPAMGYPAAAPASAAVPRFQPETIDFSGSATLPEKSSGPPSWLAIVAIAASLSGGAVLAYRVTRVQVAAIAAFDEPRPARPRPPTLDDRPPPPPAPRAAPSIEEQPEEPPAAPAEAKTAAKHPAHSHAAAKHHAPAHRKRGRH